MDNTSSFMKFQNLVQKLGAVMDKLKVNLEKGISALMSKSLKTNDLRNQIDSYRVSSSLANLNRIKDEIQGYAHFFDLAKALLAFGFQKDVNYQLAELSLGRIHEILEKKESEKMKKNMGLIEKEREQSKEQDQKRERFERVVVTVPKDEETVDFNRISIYCGIRSSQDTLGSKDQYLEAVRKLIKRFYDELRQKSFVLPQFHFILKDFVFIKIKSEIESKQILYLITDDGEKIFPLGLIAKMTDEFFRQATREYFPSSVDYSEQSNRIADSIFFEIANVENTLQKQMGGLGDDKKTALILKNFNKDNIDLYRFLLPPQKTIESIVISYLKKK